MQKCQNAFKPLTFCSTVWSSKRKFQLQFIIVRFFAALLQVHPVRALRHPHQLLPVNHFIQRPHPNWTDADAEQGETPSKWRADSVFVPVWDFPLHTFSLPLSCPL